MDLYEDVLKTIHEKQPIKSEKLRKMYDFDPLAKAISKLVRDGKIVLDELPPKDVWITK